MKSVLFSVLVISLFGCIQSQQGTQKRTPPDPLLGEWASQRMVFDAKEITHLKFSSDGRVERIEKGKETRIYSYTRRPFNAWATKEGSAKSLGLAPDDLPLQSMFAGATEVITLSSRGDPPKTEPALILILQANRSMVGFRPGSERLNSQGLFIRIDDQQKEDAEYYRADDFTSAHLLEIDPVGERKVISFRVLTSLETADTFRAVDLSVPMHFINHFDKTKPDSFVTVDGKGDISAFVVELSAEGAANMKAGNKLSHDEYKVPVKDDKVVIESARIRTAEGWVGYLKTMERADKVSSSLTYTLFRDKEYFVTRVSATVPIRSIRKDADLFVAALSKAISPRSD